MRTLSFLSIALATVGQSVAQNAIDQGTFDTIIQYTRFARASYAANCATPPNGSVVLHYYNNATTDAHATLFRWDQTKEIIISFRGTYSPSNWFSDLTFPLTALTAPGTSCSACQVHTGFQNLYNSLAPQIISDIKSAVSANPGYSVVVVGHSLGGAMAAIATASLGASGIQLAATYTYGEPRSGNTQFGSYIYNYVPVANYWRVTHANDAVPSLPPDLIGFTHHGTEYWEKATGYNNTVSTTVQCPPAAIGENFSCNLGQQSSTEINRAHVTYSNNVIGTVLYIQDCGAPYYTS